jgi:acyl-CoA dehydrogenase
MLSLKCILDFGTVTPFLGRQTVEALSGFLLTFSTNWLVVGTVVVVAALGYLGAPFFLWAVGILAFMFGVAVPLPFIIGAAVIAAVFIIPPIRKILVTSILMKVMRGFMPVISDTERIALEAGVVWMEAELFSGKPNFKRILSQMFPKLSKEEQEFMDGPVEQLCGMINDWNLWRTRDLPEDAFRFIREKGFLGMIIPREFGGKGFSNYCHSEVIAKISSRSLAAATTVMVPNSLGPAELLIHYGTDQQKKYWLPRLAKGEELPCFGLTEPQAGSDAGSITSEGVVFKGDDGQLYIRLNWRKRWITLAAVSTVIGLAFRLRDPDNLLGKGADIGITCGLIPSKLQGVVIGRRHDPLGMPFYNCPTEGKNVVVKAEDSIIGGLEGAGHGWQMLMECLAAGRGISLPAQSLGSLKVTTRVVTAHSVIRKQFGVSIGKFEGVEEPIGRIAGANYYLEAMRKFTLSALDQGIKPPVVTAIAKYNATEMGRKCVIDAMDVLGGQGISMGPRNTVAIPYICSPVGITVEGANILTRTLIIFGQGALRAHPYAFKEVDAIGKNDLKGFDTAFWKHVGHVVRNLSRSIVLSITRGLFAGRGAGGDTGRYYQKMAWASASFAIMTDLAMGLLGGKLKFAEKITGRFADVLSWMYIGTAVLYRYEAEGRRKEDLPLVHYSMAFAFNEMQKAFDGIFANFDVPVIGWLFKAPIRFWSNLNIFSGAPSDRLGHKVVTLMMADSEQRDRLTSGVYIPQSPLEAVGRIEHAFKIIKHAEGVDSKIHKAVKEKRLPKLKGQKLIDEALAKGVITPDEKLNLQKAEEARWDAIQVDDYSQAEYHSREAGAVPRPLNEAYGK